jgi:hypothetical protein
MIRALILVLSFWHFFHGCYIPFAMTGGSIRKMFSPELKANKVTKVDYMLKEQPVIPGPGLQMVHQEQWMEDLKRKQVMGIVSS